MDIGKLPVTLCLLTTCLQKQKPSSAAEHKATRTLVPLAPCYNEHDVSRPRVLMVVSSGRLVRSSTRTGTLRSEFVSGEHDVHDVSLVQPTL